MWSVCLLHAISLISWFEEMSMLHFHGWLSHGSQYIHRGGNHQPHRAPVCLGVLPLTEVHPGEALLATSTPHTLPVLRRQQELQSIYVIWGQMWKLLWEISQIIWELEFTAACLWCLLSTWKLFLYPVLPLFPTHQPLQCHARFWVLWC